MPTRAGAVWIDVLPSLSGFAAAVTTGTKVPLAAAGTQAGSQYANGLVGAVKNGLGALGVTIGRETGAAADQIAKAVELAESKVAQAKMRSEDAAGKLRVAELKLQEVRSRENATSEQIAKATGDVAKARANATKAAGDLQVSETRLEAAQKGQSEASMRIVAATEKLNLARQNEVAKTSAVSVAAAKLEDLRSKEAASTQRVTAAEDKVAKSREQVRKATQDLAQAQESTGGQASKIEANAAKLREAEDKLAQAERDAAKATRELDAARKNGVSPSQIAAAEEKLAAAERSATTASEQAGKAAKGLAAAEKEAGTEATESAGRFGKFRTSVEGGAEGMTKKIGGFTKSAIAMGVGFAGFKATEFAGESLHAAMDFQKGSQVLTTAAGELPKNMNMVRSGLMDISSKTGTSLDQMTEGMYTVEKAGFRGADGLKIMDAAAKGARDEGADLGTVTNLLTTLMANQGMSAKDSAKAMNGLMVAAGASKTTLNEYAGSLSSVLPIAKAAGLGFDQVAGALSVMTSKGMSAQNASDTLRGTIMRMEKPNTAMASAMDAFGISAQDVSSHLGQRGLQGTMQYLSDTIKKRLSPDTAAAVQTIGTMPEKLQGLYAGLSNGTVTFKQIEKAIDGTKGASESQKKAWHDAVPASQTYMQALARITGGSTNLQTALMLTTDKTGHFKKSQEEVSHALKSTDDFTKKWGISQKSASTSVAIAKQTVSNMGATLMSAFLPAISAGALGLAHFVTGVMGIAKANWGWLKWVAAGIAGIVVGLTAMRMGMAIGGTVQALAGAFGLFTAATEEGAAAQWGLNAAMDANPIGLIAVAVIAFGAALVLAYKNIGWFRDGVNAAFHAVGAIGSWLWDVVLKPAIDGIGSGFTWLWKNAIKPAGDGIAAVGSAIWDHGLKPVFSALSTAVNFVGKHWKTFATILAIPLTPVIMPLVGAFKLVQNYGGTAMRAVGKVASWLWNNALKPAFSAGAKVLQAFGSVASWLWKTAVGPTFRAIGALAGWLWRNALRPALSGIWTGMQTLAKWTQWLWKNGFSASFHAIGTIATWLWKNAISPAIHGIATVVQWLWHYAIGPIAVLIIMQFKAIASVARWLYTNGISPAFHLIGKVASWLWNNAVKPAFNLFVAGIRGLASVARWLYSNVISPTFHAVASVASWLWNNGVKPAFSLFSAGLRDLGKWVHWLYDNVIHPTWNVISSATSTLWNRGVKPIFGYFTAGLRDLGKWGHWLYDNAIKPVWNAISTTISTVYNRGIKPIFNSFGDLIGHNDNQGLRKVFKTGVNAMGSIWNGLKSAVAKPINMVIGFVDDKFIGGFNAIASKVGVTSIPKIPKIPGYAAGGVIPGPYVHDHADNVLGVSNAGMPVAKVNPGEFITRNESTRKMQRNHPGVLEHINRFGSLPGYAPGGWVSSLEHAGSKALDAGKNLVSGGVHLAEKAGSAALSALTGDAMKIARVISFATSQLGKKYVWGAAGPNAYDCSGLTHASYLSGAGMNIPHLADSQAHMGRAVNRSSLQPGDLLFPYPGHPVPHVGLAISGDQMVEAANPKAGVIGPHAIPNLGNGARRLLGNVNSTEVKLIGEMFKGLKVVGKFASAAFDPFSVLKGILDAPFNAVGKAFPHNAFAQFGVGEGKSLVDGVLSWAEDKVASMFGSDDDSGGGGGTPQSAAHWHDALVDALKQNGLPTTDAYISAWSRQIASESSGNEKAVQHGYVDVNTGHDLAKGLLQTISSTFNAYKFPGHDDIFNGHDNMLAAINYAKHKYGSSMLSVIGHGHGYANGTSYASSGVAEVAEDGAELVFGRQFRHFRGGEQVLNAKQLARLRKDGSARGESAPTVNIHGVKYDAAGEVGNELAFALRRIDNGGKYARMGG